jgi:tetratricopeptide (TPR) repeat protein
MRTPLAILLALVCGAPARAAGDDDTLRQERELFPDVLETITGKFVRHSPAFYEWQIRDRQTRLAADPNDPALADDLGVAFLQTKQFAKAIDVLTKSAEAHPDRRETHARLGRAYILAGDPKKALSHLDRALAGRPDPGPERYVRWLAEYLAESPIRRLPVAPVDPKADWPHRPRSFAVFLRTKLGKPDLDLDDARPAVAALVEFLRTGYLESLPPHEALGDLLCYSSDVGKPVARRLAARAYLRAGYLQNNPGVRKPYITLAEWTLTHRAGPGGDYAEGKEAMPVLTRFTEETDDAANWYAELSAREAEALAASPDPGGELERLYPDPPRVPDEPNDDWFTRNQGPLVRLGTIAVPGLILLALGSLGAYRFVRARRRPIPPVSGDGPAGPAAARPTALE